jgi:hypothetical protein
MRVLYSSYAEGPCEELIAVVGIPIDLDNPESCLLQEDRTYEGWKLFHYTSVIVDSVNYWHLF